MAYFSQLDESNYVTRVIFINNEDIVDINGQESEALGVELCSKICGPGIYVQTSRNTQNNVHFDPNTWLPDEKQSFRRNFGEVGFLHIAERDCFVPPPPKPWYVLDENFNWVCPPNLGPKTGQPFTHEELVYIKHLIDTNVIYAFVPVVAVDNDMLSAHCASHEYRLACITELTHGENTHTWFYTNEDGQFDIQWQDRSWTVLDASPIGWITAFSMKTDNEKSNLISKFCFEQHPQNEAFSLHECFRVIIEWAYAYTHLDNREPMAELSHNFLRAVQMPLEVRNALIENVPPQSVSLFLSNDDVTKPFFAPTRPESPPIFNSWFESMTGNFPARSIGDPLNVNIEELPDSYPGLDETPGLVQ